MNLKQYCEYCQKNKRTMWFFQSQDKSWKDVHIVQFNSIEYEKLDSWLFKQCKGKNIQFDTDFIAFENSQDAMLFKLIWG
jgi:hypothetical protein